MYMSLRQGSTLGPLEGWIVMESSSKSIQNEAQRLPLSLKMEAKVHQGASQNTPCGRRAEKMSKKGEHREMIWDLFLSKIYNL